MPRKQATPSPSAVPPSLANPTTSRPSAASTPTKRGPSTSATTTTTSSASGAGSKTNSIRNAQDLQTILAGIWANYRTNTPQRTMLIDLFMAFLVLVGAVQFVYCIVAGNFPFNAFLSGFSATVGQFVLTASLRMQTSPDNKVEFKEISHERAFADYVFGSLILHFFCVNFIN